VPIKLPLSDPDPMRRLQTLHRTLDDIIMSSTLPVGFLFAARFFGLLGSVLKRKSESPLGSLIMTNFPTPDTTSKIFGHNVVYTRFSSGFPKSGYPILFSSVSFQGSLLLQVKADAGLFPGPEATKDILAFMEDELDVLRDWGDYEEV
jgi:hypothetical protein